MAKCFTYGFALLRLGLEAELLDVIALVEILHFVSEKVYGKQLLVLLLR